MEQVIKYIIKNLKLYHPLIFKIKIASLLQNYKLKLPNSRFSKENDASFSKLSIDDCARLCNEQMSYECKSFDFCYINGDCTLSRNAAPSISDSINTSDAYTQAENCDIYESINYDKKK